jgi:hypothetical protein
MCLEFLHCDLPIIVFCDLMYGLKICCIVQIAFTLYFVLNGSACNISPNLAIACKF